VSSKEVSPNSEPGVAHSEEESFASEEVNSSMQEFYALRSELLVTTVALTSIAFLSVCFFYSINVALNYLIGSCAGVIYLRMLAKNVEQLGNQKDKLGKTQFISFVGVIILASKLEQLEILPIFLGFLTYKGAILVYMFRILFTPKT